MDFKIFYKISLIGRILYKNRRLLYVEVKGKKIIAMVDGNVL